MNGAICGGIIKETTFKRALKKRYEMDEYMLCHILPDEQYKEFQKAKKQKDFKKQKEIYSKYARSVI